MSNKQVPAVYRTIINDVIENVRAEFDEVGVEEAVLQELLRSWEMKVAQSRVADFSNDARMGAVARQFPMLPSVTAAASTVVAPAPKSKKEGKQKAEEGDDDKEEVDEDEINSDLDDPEEEVDAEDEEGGNDGDIVIALYEKVQRVKNKWRVTLKDGIVSVGGKDYLFAKCSGEFEW